jgi:murein DD-endopeptidase MepM/ murein hydrolase activator NlpD
MKVVFWMLLGLVTAASLWIWVDTDAAKPKVKLTEEQYIEATLKKLGYPEQTSGGFDSVPSERAVYVPVKGFFLRQTINPFGVFRNSRFNGYHSGVDIEVPSSDLEKDSPVYSIYEGTVASVENASGYGGVVTIKHTFGDAQLFAIYGHMRLKDIKIAKGQKVKPGELIGYLGASFTIETDGERKHLHFGLNKSGEKSILGYVNTLQELEDDWLDPTKFLRSVGAREVK